MVTRSRHEASWTSPDAAVKRPRGNQGWVVLVLGFAVIAVVATLAFNRYMNFQDVTFELRRCQAPLSAEATWQEVQAAACDTATIEGDELTMWREGSQSFADATTESSWTFEDVPVNTVVNAMEVNTGQPAESVVLAEPDNESVRLALTSDTARTRWSGHIGDRGPTTYWVLVTPAG
jgi:PhoPQ-activated pathogenicity-related protein